MRHEGALLARRPEALVPAAMHAAGGALDVASSRPMLGIVEGNPWFANSDGTANLKLLAAYRAGIWSAMRAGQIYSHRQMRLSGGQKIHALWSAVYWLTCAFDGATGASQISLARHNYRVRKAVANSQR
jgi:hypothetical protein